MEFESQRKQNIDELTEKYNKTLDTYLEYYEKFLMYRSSNIYNSKNIAQNKYRPLVIKYNGILLDIINELYDDIQNEAKRHDNVSNKNDKKRRLILQNKNELEDQLNTLLQNDDQLLTNTEKLKQIESIYKDKKKVYIGFLVTDIIVGLIVMAIFLLSLRSAY